MRDDKLNTIAITAVKGFLIDQGEGRNNKDTWLELTRTMMLTYGIPESKMLKIMERYYKCYINEFGEADKIENRRVV